MSDDVKVVDEDTADMSEDIRIDTYEELREQRAAVDGHRSPCAMDW